MRVFTWQFHLCSEHTKCCSEMCTGLAFLAHEKQSLQLLGSGEHAEAAATRLWAVCPWQCQGTKKPSLKDPHFQMCASSLAVVLSLCWLLWQPWGTACTTLWFLAWEVSELQSPSSFWDSWTSWSFRSMLSYANFHKQETTVLIKNTADVFYLYCQLLIVAWHVFIFAEGLDIRIIADRWTRRSVLSVPLNICYGNS